MSDTAAVGDDTGIGSYFVATYPPFSVWTPEAVAADAMPALERPPPAGVPLGLYLHIPFCRKRCHFCYFRVYTDKNAQRGQRVPRRRWRASGSCSRGCRRLPGRPLDFVYFGGGTPSFLSTQQLEGLVDAADRA